MPFFDIKRANEAVELRLLGEHQIAYTLVGPQEEAGLAVPDLLRSRFVRTIGDLPKSGLQLINPAWYQYHHLQRGLAQPVRFGVIFEKNFAAQASDFFKVPALLHVVAWFGEDDTAIDALSKVNAPLAVVSINGDLEQRLLKRGVPESRLVRTPDDILARIEKMVIEKIARSPDEFAGRKDFVRRIAEEWRNRVLPGPLIPFYPLGPNKSQIRQMLGQFQSDFWPTDESNPFEKRPAAQAESFGAVVETIGAVATSHDGPWKFDGQFPTAILAFPSISPILRKVLISTIEDAGPDIRPAAKEVMGARMAEQDSTTFQSFTKTAADDPENAVAQIGLAELGAYTRFFDDMGYLHGSFHSSPYLRAPVKGASLAQHHSFFSPKSFRIDSKPGAIRRKVDAFSRALRHSLHPEMHAAIVNHPGGLLALSDLPIEWMEGDGAPLAFTHDLCRIPESGPTNLLSQFNRNASSTFAVGPEILTKTLVVCGAPRDDIISKSFDVLEEIWKRRRVPWRWVRCSSLSELFGIVNEVRPELLIFDTHGQFGGNDVGTEMQIGSERLNGDNVIANFPQVPLVMLSTCWGAPLYGNPNTIAHAFFEAGSFSVTTSMLPLHFLKGATLYDRVLHNLESAAKTPLHPNWSSFISHNVRTSYFDDLKSLVSFRHPDKLVPAEEYSEIRGPWQMKTMDPGTRREAYATANQTVIQCFKPSIKSVAGAILERNELIPEFMFYSTMGRADLIQFAVWNKRHCLPQERMPRMGDFIAQGTLGALKSERD